MLKNDISQKALGAAWAKILDKAHYHRRGRLVGSAIVRTEVAFDGAATGIMVVPATGIVFDLDAHTELWARCENGAAGPSELFGQMIEV